MNVDLTDRDRLVATSRLGLEDRHSVPANYHADLLIAPASSCPAGMNTRPLRWSPYHPHAPFLPFDAPASASIHHHGVPTETHGGRLSPRSTCLAQRMGETRIHDQLSPVCTCRGPSLLSHQVTRGGGGAAAPACE